MAIYDSFFFSEILLQAYAAGMIEGHVTSEILYMYWQNTVDGYCDGKEKLCDKLVKFVNSNTKWVKKKLKSHPDLGKHPYWHQLNLLYLQLEGLEAGYDGKVQNDKNDNRIPHGDIFWMNIFGDLEDLEQVFDINDEFNKTRILGSGSCSALIKVCKILTNTNGKIREMKYFLFIFSFCQIMKISTLLMTHGIHINQC